MANNGQAWFERHQAQAAAARKRPHKQLESKRPGKARRNDWKRADESRAAQSAARY